MLALPVSVSQRVPKILMQYTILFFYSTFTEKNITTHKMYTNNSQYEKAKHRLYILHNKL